MTDTTNNRLLLSFEDAAGFVQRHRLIAYSFVPPTGEAGPLTGRLYVLWYLEEFHAIEAGLDKGVGMTVVTGGFNNGYVRETNMDLNDIPAEAKTLAYQLIQLNAFQYAYYRGLDIRTQLKIMTGLSEQAAFDRSACRRCDWVLFKTGRPDPCFQCRAEKSRQA